jgi:hypothetical protein
MAINSIFYLNGSTLSTATSVYLDAALTILAPDGFYGDGTISREQSSGILLTAETCSACNSEIQCFEGITEGGSITYIDANGGLTTQSGIGLGEIIGVSYLEIISYTGIEQITCPLRLGLRSEDGLPNTTGVCAEEITVDVYILTSTAPVISTGDVACNTNNIADRFIGGNLYYKVQELSGTETEVYICQINDEGIITVDSACPV